MTKDYYKILNLEKNATPEEIRKQYKKLAMKWHPDKNRDNHKTAEEKFKEISEAYQVLSDPEKRKRYDNPYSFGDFDFQGFTFQDPSFLFKSFYKKGFFDDEDDDFFKDHHFSDEHFGKEFGKGFGKNWDNFGDFGTFKGTGNSKNFSTQKSVSKSTTIKNGKKVTVTTTKMKNPDGTEIVEKVEEIDEGNGKVTVNQIKNGE